MISPAVISLNNILKIYNLYTSPIDRLKETFHPLNKQYHRKFIALQNISMSVNKGESVGIVGKNGSGKTTLLQIICGISEPTAGSLQVNGKIAALLALGAGFNPNFTGRQNVYLNAAILGLHHTEIQERFDDIAGFADIGEFIDQPVKTYSSGMYVRLAFAVAIHTEPDIFVVDEALAVGDDFFKRKCYAKIETFLSAGNTLLFVSHSLNTINEICNRAIILDKGEIILDGQSKMVTNQYQRFLLSTSDKINTVRDDINKLNSELRRDKKLENILKSSHDLAGRNKFIGPEIQKDNDYVYRSEYLPNLQSQTRIEYKNAEVDICDIQVRTLDGGVVNSLIMGEEYIYAYSVHFNMDAANIIFGMLITNDKGIQISGRNTPDGDEERMSCIEKGDRYLIEWNFQCNLVPGLYYLNVGVSSEINGERIFLNRIVDAMVIDVKKNNKFKYLGFVNFHQQATVTRILNE